MYSQELENLIQATLEDGVLEENEKAALIKRAEREGVDIAELEIYINSLLQKRARELENEKNAVRKQAEKEKKEAFGRKCPNCGAQVPPLTLKCECGYEFTRKDSVSSSRQLMEKIEEISLSNANKDEVDKLIQQTISLFPVPNTKEDIVEFLSLSSSYARKRGGLFGTIAGRFIILFTTWIFLSAVFGFMMSQVLFNVVFFVLILIPIGIVVSKRFARNYDQDTIRWNKIAEVWRSKFDQVLMKGRSLRGDAEFTRQLDYYENMLNK